MPEHTHEVPGDSLELPVRELGQHAVNAMAADQLAMEAISDPSPRKARVLRIHPGKDDRISYVQVHLLPPANGALENSRVYHLGSVCWSIPHADYLVWEDRKDEARAAKQRILPQPQNRRVLATDEVRHLKELFIQDAFEVPVEMAQLAEGLPAFFASIP